MPPSPRTLVAPYPQKSHTATRVAIFGGPRYFLRAHQNMRVAFTLSASLSANGGKKAKAWFCLFRGIVLCAPHSSFLHKQKYLQFGVRGAPNAVNFAERPLAGIHAKLTKLRDNTVVAMRGFACASNYLVHKFCFKLLKQNFVSLRGNPNGFPLAVRHFGAHILL